MTEAALHRPDLPEILFFLWVVGCPFYLEWRKNPLRPPWRDWTFGVYTLAQAGNVCGNNRTRAVCLAAYLIFLLTRIIRRFPWDKWKKKLGSAVSGLTEVMRASLRREQSEALS